MSNLNKLHESMEKGKLKFGQIEELKKLFQSAINDGRMSSRKLAQIQIFYYESELSEKDFTILKGDVFKEVVEAAIADHMITEQEESKILRVAEHLGVSPEWKEWAHRQIQKYTQADKTSTQ